MNNWWIGLTSYQQVLFVIAVATTLFMLIQIIMMFISGLGDDASFDNDVDLDSGDGYNDEGVGISFFGLKILSVRTIIAFLAIFCWVTFTLLDALPVWASTLLGILAGCFAAVGVAYIMKSIDKLQSSGNIDIKNAVGKVGDVYLVIPPSRKGNGKVNVFVQERYVEYEAITDDGEPIKTGDKVKIVSLLNEGTVIVERI